MTDPLEHPLRVALVDDQPLVRAGFAMVIDSQPDLDVVVQAADGLEAVEQLRARRVDVVLMDVRMPRLDGIEATARLLEQSRQGHAPKVIVLTTFDLDEYVVAAIRAGASGFLLKDAQPEDLLTAIRTVHRGEDRKSTRLNSSHVAISYAVFCLKKKKEYTACHIRHC